MGFKAFYTFQRAAGLFSNKACSSANPSAGRSPPFRRIASHSGAPGLPGPRSACPPASDSVCVDCATSGAGTRRRDDSGWLESNIHIIFLI